MSAINLRYTSCGVVRYYRGRYIPQKEARELIASGKCTVKPSMIEPYPVKIILELTRLQLLKEQYETRKRIQTQTSSASSKATA